jgi:DNA-binding GntR family transcriptional regulator
MMDRSSDTKPSTPRGPGAAGRRAVERPGNLPDIAYDRFRRALRSGELKPGARLLEVSLAQSFGMSRTPVRQAMQRLQAEGLVMYAPPRGLCVATYSPAQIDELYEMREALEGTAARLAAQHAGPAEAAFLQTMAQAEGLLQEPPETIAEQNRRFHQAIHEATHNRHLLRAIGTMADALLLLGRTTLSVPGRAAEARREHMAVADAIAMHDPAAAEAAARSHIRAAYRARLGLYSGR